MKRRFFIRNFILVALPVLLAVLLLGSMAAYVTMKSAQKAIVTANEQAVSRIRESTELIFSEADAQSLNYSFSPTVILRLEDLLSNGYSGKEQIDTSSIIKTFLDSNVNSKMYLHSIYIYLANEKQNFFASSVGVANSQNFGDLAWMERLDSVPYTEKQWLEPRTINAYSISSYSTDVLSLFKRLYTSDRQKPSGALVMNIRKEYLTSFYSAYLTYPGQSILLLNSEGVLLCGTGNLKDTTALPDLQSLEKYYYIAQQSNAAYGVVYVSLIPRSAVSIQAQEMVPVVVGAVFLALVMGSLLAYFTSRRNARDVGNILQLVDSAEHGRELPNLPASSDAYGYIMQGIVKAFVEKSLLDKQLIEKKYTLEAMHFSFLQSQLNPHFLFNTLKNIFWKTVRLTGEPNDASHMIDLLTSVLYYALVNRERYVPIAEEIENTQKYIEIQQMRFDYSFSVDWHLSKSVRDVKCIKFLLQPILENSISHGLYDKPNGKISIDIEQKENRMFVAVTDNGHGFAEERLLEIRARLATENSPVESIGLYNLNKRLILAYGEAAGIFIASRPEEKTTVYFSIPLAQPGPQDI